MRTYYLYIILLLISGHLATAQSSSTSCKMTLFCQDLNTTFMPDTCMVDVWAKDFVSKVEIDGNPVSLDDLWISFEPDAQVMNRSFFSIDGNEQMVTVYVSALPGPFSSSSCRAECVSILNIRDNTGMCPGLNECPLDPNVWCGFSVMTCGADTLGDVVASIIDVRANMSAPRGDDWANPSGSAAAIDVIRPAAWTIDDIGAVFGTATKVATGEIFFAASDIYAFDFKEIVDINDAIPFNLISVGFAPPTATGSAGPAGIYRSQFDSVASSITITPIIGTTTTYQDTRNTSMIPNTGNFTSTNNTVDASNQFELFDSSRTTYGNGLGNITYDRRSNHLFVSNLEDGKIYSINCRTNTVTDIFDPFEAYADHASDGIVIPSERVWGLEVRDCSDMTSELFFARNTTQVINDVTTPRSKTIWRVNFNSFGQFIQTDGNELPVLTDGRGSMNKFTDIAFDRSCDRMLLAERGYPHEARVFEYRFDGTNWVFDKQVFVGVVDQNQPAQPRGKIVGSSTAGGVTYGAKSNMAFVDAECDELIWSTVQCGDTREQGGVCNVYGLQGISAAGNDTLTLDSTDIFVGIAPDPGTSVLRLKSNLGDVEIFSCCCPDGPVNLLNQLVSVEVSGFISSPVGNPMDNIAVNLTSDGMSLHEITDDAGSYAFVNLPAHNNYMIKPEAGGSESWLDGVSTLDLVKIQRHILGVEVLDNNWKEIAADVDQSGSITARDLITLRKQILGIDGSDVQSWKIVADNGSAEPLDYLMTEDLDAEMKGDFVAIKSGDVTFDNSRYEVARPRSISAVQLSMDRSTPNNINFVSGNNAVLQGIQFELRDVPVDLEITSEIIDLDESNVNITLDGHLRLSWNQLRPVAMGEGESLFTVSTTDKTWRPEFGTAIASELYGTREVFELKLSSTHIESTHEHLTVAPNPFSDVVTISSMSTDESAGSLRIYDGSGKLIINQNVSLTAGQNSFTLDVSEVHSSDGLYFIQLVTPLKTTTAKAIRLR
ncbi:MAG: T9SS type A sorting domain-containing protein [Bacteroidota bacterium]